jgi:hypothetical protein
MSQQPCPPESVVAAWAVCSPATVEAAPTLPNSPGWKELKGKDTWIYLRVTKAAAHALAEQLLRAAEGHDPAVATGQPESEHSGGPVDHPFGFFIHPHGSSLTIEVADMPPIQSLMEVKPSNAELLSPDGTGKHATTFKR